MKFKKGRRGSFEWDQMIVDHNGNVALGVHFVKDRLNGKEKAIITKHLADAAQDIKNLRS